VTDHQPNDLEDRVRDAYQSAARTVQTLQRTSPVLAAGSVRRPRRMNALAPLAAAAAVIVVIAASVALPRLLAGSARNPAAPQVSATWHYPPFQLVETNPNNSDARLQVESAATGHVVTTVAPPRPGATWGAITAVGDTGRFIVAADPKPSSSSSYPTRLYTLTLTARGTVAGLTPLGVPVLQGGSARWRPARTAARSPTRWSPKTAAVASSVALTARSASLPIARSGNGVSAG